MDKCLSTILFCSTVCLEKMLDEPLQVDSYQIMMRRIKSSFISLHPNWMRSLMRNRNKAPAKSQMHLVPITNSIGLKWRTCSKKARFPKSLHQLPTRSNTTTCSSDSAKNLTKSTNQTTFVI